jgi:hypothetical protein
MTDLRLAAEQRKRIAARIKELQPAASTRRIAGVVGADQSTVVRELADANASLGAENGSDINGSSAETDANASPALSGRASARLAAQRESGAAERRQRTAAA